MSAINRYVIPLAGKDLAGPIFRISHPFPMWVYCAASRSILAANQAAALLYGYSQEEMTNLTIFDLRPEEMREDLERVLSQFEEDAPSSVVSTHMKKSREPFQAEIHPNPVMLDGQLAYWVTARDITVQRLAQEGLRETQERYRSIFENAVEGIFQTSREGRYISANPALARMYGYESADELMESLSDIAHGLYINPRRRQEFAAIMQRKGKVENFESEVRKKNGSTIWIRESARAVYTSSGEFAYYEGMVEDITKRKRLEEERERMLADAMRRADYDPLTDLVNHRAFQSRMEAETENAEQRGGTYAVVILDMQNFGFFNETYGHAAGDDLLRRISSSLTESCRRSDLISRYGSDEFAVLLPNMRGSDAVARINGLLADLSDQGYHPPGSDSILPLQFAFGYGEYPADGGCRQEILAAAEQRLLAMKTGRDENSLAALLRERLLRKVHNFSMLDALITAVDAKDRYTRRHSEDVMKYCLRIAQALGLDHAEQERLQAAALLHDVGKIGVPDYILRKPGQLNDEERQAIMHHPLMGAVIVGAVPGFEHTLDAIRHHHERWDGDGYPYGLVGKKIPLSGRIMAVADAYSAMTTDRPYRRCLSQEIAVRILSEGAGTQWDPECVAAFLGERAVTAASVTAQAA